MKIPKIKKWEPHGALKAIFANSILHEVGFLETKTWLQNHKGSRRKIKKKIQISVLCISRFFVRKQAKTTTTTYHITDVMPHITRGILVEGLDVFKPPPKYILPLRWLGQYFAHFWVSKLWLALTPCLKKTHYRAGHSFHKFMGHSTGIRPFWIKLLALKWTLDTKKINEKYKDTRAC